MIIFAVSQKGKTMRLIDADALKDKSYWECYSDPDDDYEYVLVTDIDRAPTIEAEPVRRGRWETRNEYSMYSIYCSACGRWQMSRTKYCPDCGAKMEVGDA